MSRSASARSVIVERGALIVIVGFFLVADPWMLTTAYKPARDIFSIPPTLLFAPTLDNFRSVFRYFDLPRLIESSL